MFSEIPIAPYYAYEMYPLADFNESMKTIIETLKQAERMFPAAPPK